MNEYLTGTKKGESCFIREDEEPKNRFYAVAFDVNKRERKTIDFIYDYCKASSAKNIDDLYFKITNNYYIIVTPYFCSSSDVAGCIKYKSLKDKEQVMVVEIESFSNDGLLPYQGLNKETQNNLQEWYIQSLTIKL